MNIRSVIHVIAIPAVLLGIALALCWGVSVLQGDPQQVQSGMAWSAGIALLCALLMWVTTLGAVDLNRRDGFAIVTFGWIGMTVIGSLPYVLTGALPDPVDALFETMSGLTTTGATVMSDLETMPATILFWRSLTQWFGGMGVLVLCVAILPFLGVGGMQIYQAEMPGPSADRLTPRITSTAKLLWGVYVLLTLVEALLLMAGPMEWFDALCHAFTTMSTGGFSTRSGSIGAFDSVYVETVVTVFMFLAGVNFVLHFRALTGRPVYYIRDREFVFYVMVWAVIVMFTTLNLWASMTYGSILEAFRASAFTVTSILTTTGYSTADFDQWHTASRICLIVLMFFGGCAGSTSGGMKMLRIYIVWKKLVRDIRRFVQPQGVFHVKLGEATIQQEVVTHVTGFVLIFIGIFALATVLMSFWTPDLVTAFSSVVATLGNIGPGLGDVGATRNYASIASEGKILLALCMLLGRLELYTVLVFFLPSFWRK
jgi:trk system potassium uptake protein TrkH